jgi:hypothetical protein
MHAVWLLDTASALAEGVGNKLLELGQHDEFELQADPK